MKIDIRKTASDAGHVALGASVVAAQQVQARAQSAIERITAVQDDLSDSLDKVRAELESRANVAADRATSLRAKLSEQAKTLADAAEPYTDAIKTKATELVADAKERIEPAVERVTELVARRAA